MSAVASLAQVRPLDLGAAQWDDALGMLGRPSIFHGSAWLAYLLESQGGAVLRAEVCRGGTRIGLLCGLLTRRAWFKIFGSPLRGWLTVTMGPMMAPGIVADASVVAAIEAFLLEIGVDHTELAHLDFDEATMTERGFVSSPFPTMWVPLGPEGEMMGRLDGLCRNRIRKARKNGLHVEEASDLAFVDEYYAQLEEVFGRQGLAPAHSKAQIRALYSNLISTGHLLALRVRLPNGETAATGLYPFDGRFLYYLGGASWHRYKTLCPNDLMMWEAMRRAAACGAVTFDIGGGVNRFKAKFGGTSHVIHRWRKSYSPLARVARGAYFAAHMASRRLGGLLKECG